MRGFVAGLVVGVAVGAGGMYFAQLERPGEAQARVSADAGAEPDQPDRRRRGKRRKRANTRNPDAPVEVSAADRALTWRGPKPELSARDVDLGAAGGGRALNAGEIQQGVRSNADAVVACIEDSRGNAELTATLTLEALVEGDGAISTMRMRAPRYLHEHGLLPCVQRAARAMQFPATGAQTIVTVPFDLR